MWTILKSEWRYNWLLVSAFGLLLLVMRFIHTSSGDLPPILVFLMFFFVLQNTAMIKQRENRLRQFMAQPLAPALIGLTRLLVPLSYFGMLYLLFSMPDLLELPGRQFFRWPAFATSVIVLMSGYSMFLILQDRVSPWLRSRGITAKHVKSGFVLLLLLTNVLGVAAWFAFAGRGRVAPWLRSLFDFLGSAIPFRPETNLAQAVFVCLLLCGLSVWTFTTVRNHTERGA